VHGQSVGDTYNDVCLCHSAVCHSSSSATAATNVIPSLNGNEWLDSSTKRSVPHPIIAKGRQPVNLPDAPVAREVSYVTHFFTVSNPEKSKDFYFRILGGKVIKSENPCYIKLANSIVMMP
jgi:hypothetical protein